MSSVQVNFLFSLLQLREPPRPGAWVLSGAKAGTGRACHMEQLMKLSALKLAGLWWFCHELSQSFGQGQCLVVAVLC